MYHPDKWLVVKISDSEKALNYRVFATWSGSYLGGSSWRMNSGITEVTREGKHLIFKGASGSEYHCHDEFYGSNSYGTDVLSSMVKNSKDSGIFIEVMPSDTDWEKLEYV
jgi:hypothetical protein